MFIDDLKSKLIEIGVGGGITLFVTSDVLSVFYDAYRLNEEITCNDIINLLQELITPNGNLIFPTYNWKFCKGITFDYNNTRSETGSLTQTALERDDFIRTKHPIYSFAVWGKDAKYLASLDYKDSFGEDSIFAWFEKVNAINLFLGMDGGGETFIHFCQERENVPYRFIKDFTAEYIDKDGNKGIRTYSMFVRYLDKLSENYEAEALTELLKKYHINKDTMLHNTILRTIDMKSAYKAVKNDILYNNSLRTCIYWDNEHIVNAGKDMYELLKKLFPICRSLTGNGVRQTLGEIKKILPSLEIHEVPTGTKVQDWTIPKEWNINDGWIKNSNGEKIIDFKENNLHIMGYSIPVHKKVSLEELKEYIYTLPNQPDLIPYITSYYKERFGFCMSHNQFKSLKDDEYEIFIDSTLEDGSLTYADLVIPGETDEEIMLTTYVCHPSLANNELSGPVLATYLAKYLQGRKNKYTYRFVFNPETIGSITYITKNLEHLKSKLKAGFILTCVGDYGDFSYVASRYGNTLADKAAKSILSSEQPNYNSYSFLDRGSDERQYCAPGVDLPVCSVMRTKYGEYPEYHTSGDNLSIVSPYSLSETFNIYLKIIEALEENGLYKIKCLCEPQLGKRGLYPTTSTKESGYIVKNMMDIIAYLDGKNDLFDISQITGVKVLEIIEILKKLKKANLIEKVL